MTSSHRWGWLAAAMAALAAAGCGSASGQAGAPTGQTAPPSLATSLTTGGGSWAVAELGGSAADYNNFWQLFVRPAGNRAWRLVTPPGMASNGGLVMAAAGGQALTAGFRPSQQISFSPLASTGDSGGHWAPGLIDAGLAYVPDALAAAPGSGRLIALLPRAVEISRPGGSGWATVATQQSLGASARGRACGLAALTAVAFSPAGTPLAAGACTHPGRAGVFAFTGGTWRAAGPPLPAALAGRPVTVLRLSLTGGRETLLLAAGTGVGTVVAAAWADGGAGRWALSPAVRLHGAQVRSVSFGPAGEVGLITGAGHGETLAGPGASWQQLPALPPGAQTLAVSGGQPVEVLAAHRSVLTVWQHSGTGWSVLQRLKVPIQYGSSG